MAEFDAGMKRGLSCAAGYVAAERDGGTARAPRARRADTGLHICFVAMNIFPVLSGESNDELVGGAEVQQTLLVRALAADGFRVTVLTADHGQPEVVDSGGVRIHRVRSPGMRGIKGLRFIHPHLTDVVTALRHIDPDIVYFRTAGFRAAAVAWYARLAHKPFVYACASDLELLADAKEPSSPRDARLFRLALRYAHTILVQNVRQRQLLKDNLGREGVVLPNCYWESGSAVGAADGHILWVGTVRPLKSPEVFIELARRHPARRFRMVGGASHQDPAGPEYFERIRASTATVPNLEFVGYVPFRDVGKHFDHASVLVNTSQTEGFPNTFLQAWIRGVPTLSFVNPEVTAGESGTIACADIDELASRIGSLTGTRWEQASAACKAHFGRVHSVEAALQGYRELFNRLAGRGTVAA
jgi:glycosyltransferase involved in cell wall biosynthesis